MGGVKRKLVVLSIEEKMEILNFLDRNPSMKKGQVAEKFDLPASTLSTIIKHREDVEQRFLVNKKARKSRKCTFPEVDECVKNWVTQCRDQGISISGKIVQKKAEDFARELGQGENFKCSNGWLESFKNRHAIYFKRKRTTNPETCAQGIPAVVKGHKSTNPATCAQGIPAVVKGHKPQVIKKASIPETVHVQDITALVKGYKPQDIFIADETGLIYQCLSDKTAMIEDQECRGGKTCLTVLLACNKDGSEKLAPLMIGRLIKPRCFARVKSFPLKYIANEKAWMTGDIFRNWLKSLDDSMVLQKRKILLFIDNCSDLPILKNITVKFLSASIALKLQPLLEDITRSFKINYRRQLVCKLLDAVYGGKTTPPEITMLDAMRMIDCAWRSVTPDTIKNCFKNAFGINKCQEENGIIIKEETVANSNKVLEISSQEWSIIKSGLNVDITLEEFLKMDDSLPTCGTFTESEVAEDARSVVEDEENDDEHEIRKVTFNEAVKSLELLTTFLESQENIGSEGFGAIYTLKQIIETNKKACKKNNG